MESKIYSIHFKKNQTLSNIEVSFKKSSFSYLKKRSYRNSTVMKDNFNLLFLSTVIIANIFSVSSQTSKKAVPIFKYGEAQIVPEFENSEKWIQHDLWVQTEFDSYGDGKLDRMHVNVTRPYQTDSESLKFPIIYVSSPYFAGNSGIVKGLMWNVKHELGEIPQCYKRE